MLTSLFTGVSGLNANMTELSVIGNNIANMNTVGFKSSRASFADILSQSIGGVSSSPQVGLGVSISAVNPVFTQGAFQTTNNGLDMAIDGEGFFSLSDSSGANFYSRAGQFNLDKNGNIINPEGFFLRGYQADSAGIIGSTVANLQLSFTPVPPNATDQIGLVANLNSDADVTGFIFSAGSNEDIYFSDDGGATNYTANLITDGGLIAGTAYTGSQVASAIKTAMEATNGTTDTYTVTYDATAGQFTIANDTGNGVLVLDWSNAAATAETILGFTAASSGNISAGSSDISDTTGGQFSVTDADKTSNFATTITVNDSLGNTHPVSIYFRKSLTSATGNTWQWNAVVPAADSANITTGSEVQASGTITFSPSGALSNVSTVTYATGGFDFAGGSAQNQQITFDFGTSTAASGTGLDGVTQYGQNSSIFDQTQDGFGSGSLQGTSVDANGILSGIYSNGRTRNLGQVILADFSNPTALSMQGNNLFAESNGSGAPLIGVPRSSGMGNINSSTLELSTVDVAEEFVKMITAQRGFQANSRIITTTDEILAELVNLKR